MGALDLCKKPSGWFKIIEICVGVITLALAAHYDFLMVPYQHADDYSRAYLCIITTGGFLLLSCVLVIGYSVDKSFGKAPYQEMVANILGAILNVAAGACMLEIISHHDMDNAYEKAGLAYGVLTLINGIIYGIDAFLAYRQKSG